MMPSLAALKVLLRRLTGKERICLSLGRCEGASPHFRGGNDENDKA
jgi:hypothetical protein